MRRRQIAVVMQGQVQLVQERRNSSALALELLLLP